MMSINLGLVILFSVLLAGCSTTSSAPPEAAKAASAPVVIAPVSQAQAAPAPAPIEKAQPVNPQKAADDNIKLGIAYLQEDNMPRAKEKLLRAMSFAPNYAPAYGAMAYYMQRTGSPVSAKKYYLQAIKLDPKSGITQNNYGVFLCQNGAYQEAVKHLLVAASDPTYLNTASAYENAGVCAERIPDVAAAEKYLKRALQEDPRRASVAFQLAKLNFEKNDFQQAVHYLTVYKKLGGKSAQADALTKQIAGNK